VVLDYQIVGETQDKKIHLLIVAAKRNLIQSLMDSYHQAGLHPVLIDAAGFAVCNAFFFNQIHKNAGEAIGVIHIAKELTVVNVLKQNTGYFSRDISMGESQVQSDAALLVDLANEIRYTFDYYESQWSDTVKKVYVSGNLAPGLLDSFQKALGLEASFWDPTLAFEIGGDIPQGDFEKMKPHLHLALGLAIRNV
jgi:Tfp pilus assembly PilM family ATPase